LTKDEVIEDHYGWWLNESTNNKLEKLFGAGAAACFVISLAAF